MLWDLNPTPNKKGTWLVWYSKRHPVTGAPIQLRRTGLRSKAEARKAEAQLIIEVENKIRRKVVPSWAQYGFRTTASTYNRKEPYIENR